MTANEKISQSDLLPSYSELFDSYHHLTIIFENDLSVIMKLQRKHKKANLLSKSKQHTGNRRNNVQLTNFSQFETLRHKINEL